MTSAIFLDTLIQKHSPAQCINASGLNCPLPLLKLKQGLHQLSTKQIIYIITTDKNSPTDIQRYCSRAALTLLHTETIADTSHLLVQKN